MKALVDVVSKDLFELMVADLTKLEEGREDILDLFPYSSEARRQVNDVLENYITVAEAFLSRVHVRTVNTIQRTPVSLVLIHCEVEILDLDTREIHVYRLDHPFHKSLSLDTISYISPVGLALLIKGISDTVAIKTPGGSLNFLIRQIHLCRKFHQNNEDQKV